LDVSTTRGIVNGLDRAQFGDRHLEVGQQLQQEGLELLIGAVDLVDQQHRRLDGPADRRQQRPLQQIIAEKTCVLYVAASIAAPRAP
jgi:hypothetical protein